MGQADIFEALQSAQAADASVFRAPLAEQQQHGVMGAINDAWGYASNHKLETTAIAATAAAATAAIVYCKPWRLVQAAAGEAGENVGTRLLGANATERLVAAGMPITAETRAAVAAGLAKSGAVPAESLVFKGVAITAENRAIAMTATTLALHPGERAAAIAAGRMGLNAAGGASAPAIESLIASGIPINAANRHLAARGLLRHITGR